MQRLSGWLGPAREAPGMLAPLENLRELSCTLSLDLGGAYRGAMASLAALSHLSILDLDARSAKGI